MAAHQKFNVPDEIDDILDRLLVGLALHVPDDFLAIWFPPGIVDGVMEEDARKLAESYALTCGCSFSHHMSLGEGRFYRPPKNQALRSSHPQA